MRGRAVVHVTILTVAPRSRAPPQNMYPEVYPMQNPINQESVVVGLCARYC